MGRLLRLFGLAIGARAGVFRLAVRQILRTMHGGISAAGRSGAATADLVRVSGIGVFRFLNRGIFCEYHGFKVSLIDLFTRTVSKANT
jgi:hypothetical protein